jgi:hypothetical protein
LEIIERRRAQHGAARGLTYGDQIMPKVSSAKSLPLGETPNLKRSSSEVKLDNATDIAKRASEEERKRVKEKTERLRKARLDAESKSKRRKP